VNNTSESFQVPPTIIQRRMGNETLLINLNTNEVYSLNYTSTRFWELLSTNHSKSEIIRILMEEFDVSEETLQNEIDNLINQLQAKDFIIAQP
jgi:hypothetical protein